MTKRLVYVFYIANGIDNFDNFLSYKIHFNCLKYFSEIFNKAQFVISVDDLNNKLIDTVKKFIYDNFSHCSELNVVVEKNDLNIREAKWFCKYVINKLDDYDGYTYFNHTKGVSNEISDKLNVYWITSMYWFNLITNPVETISDEYVAYGFPYIDYKMNTMKDFCEIVDQLNHIRNNENELRSYSLFGQQQALKTKFLTYHHCWHFAGSSYWMNCQKIAKFIKDNECLVDYTKYMPWWFDTMMTAEFFLTDLFTWYDVNYPHKEDRTQFELKEGWDAYDTFTYLCYLKYMIPENEINTYMNFHEQMISDSSIFKKFNFV